MLPSRLLPSSVAWLHIKSQQYALAPKLFKVLTFSYARYNGIVIHPNCPKNSSAGADWFTNFMKSHPRLTLRKPEGTSIARAGAPNHPVMENFYDQVEVLYKKYDFTDDKFSKQTNRTILLF